MLTTLSRSYCNANKYNSFLFYKFFLSFLVQSLFLYKVPEKAFPKPAFSPFHEDIWYRFLLLLDAGSCFLSKSGLCKEMIFAGRSSISFLFLLCHLCSSSLFIPGFLNKENTDFYSLFLIFWGVTLL